MKQFKSALFISIFIALIFPLTTRVQLQASATTALTWLADHNRSVYVLDNGTSEGKITSPWNIPQIHCDPQDYCRLISRVDQNGVLYVNWVDEKKLFIVPPDGSQAITVDLTSVIDSLPAGQLIDFIPFEDGTIVFEGPPIISGTASRNYNLYFYNFKNNQAMRLSELFPGDPTKCDPSIYTQFHGFYRIGNKDSKKIVACSRDSDGIYDINVLDLNSMAVEETIPTRRSLSESDIRPWAKLQGGNDGKLYVQFYPEEFGRSFLKDVMTDISDAYKYIARHTLGTTNWSIIPIPESILSNLPSVSSLESLTFVGVDELGNLYFSILWTASRGDSFHQEFVKLSPEGTVIWHVTEANFGKLGSFVDLIHEDHFVTQLSFRLKDLKAVEIDKDIKASGK